MSTLLGSIVRRSGGPQGPARYILRQLAAALLIAAPAARAPAQCDPQELAKLLASDAAAGDRFGISVAVSGDTAVIGAYNDDHAGGTNAGSAYVFVRSGGVWTQQAKLTASDAAEYDHFGISVSVSGDTAVIGADYDDHAGGTNAGSAYVFVRSGGVWTEQAKLTRLPTPRRTTGSVSRWRSPATRR